MNDGSQVASLVIIKDYTKKDSRIKVIDKPNSGYGHTINRGISMTSVLTMAALIMGVTCLKITMTKLKHKIPG